MNIQIFTNLKEKIRAFVAKENLNDLYVKKTSLFFYFERNETVKNIPILI